jgi:putative transposase
MGRLAFAKVAYIRAFFVLRHKPGLEAPAFGQQRAVFKRRCSRPVLNRVDRFFWTALRQLYSDWPEALIIVKLVAVGNACPADHGFMAEIRDLIRRLKSNSPCWGAPRMPGELLQFGFRISEATVQRHG